MNERRARKKSLNNQKELPGLQGFSERNIRNMRQFYETWSKLLIWQPAAAKIQSPVATQLQLTPSRLDFSRDVSAAQKANRKVIGR